MRNFFLLFICFCVSVGAAAATISSVDLFVDYKITNSQDLINAIDYNIDKEKIIQNSDHPDLTLVATKFTQYLKNHKINMSTLFDEDGWNVLHHAIHGLDFDVAFIILYASFPEGIKMLKAGTWGKNSAFHILATAKGSFNQKKSMLLFLWQTATVQNKFELLELRNGIGQTPSDAARKMGDPLFAEFLDVYRRFFRLELQKQELLKHVSTPESLKVQILGEIQNTVIVAAPHDILRKN